MYVYMYVNKNKLVKDIYNKNILQSLSSWRKH